MSGNFGQVLYAIGMQFTYHLVTLNDALQKDSRLLLNK